MRAWILAATLTGSAVLSAQTLYPPTEGDLSKAPLASNATVSDSANPPVSLTFDQIVDDWLANTSAIRPLPCIVGGTSTTCLVVPKFGDSRHCGTGDYDWTICEVPLGQRNANNFCMVSDELSQVGMALSMRGNEETFEQWVNTIRLILDGNPRYPLWNVTVSTNGVTTTMTPWNHDDASDATARVITALYIAAGSSSYGSASRRRYRLLADELADGFRKDFADTGANTSPRYWLAAGRNSAGPGTTPVCTNCNDPYGYSGYYGDAAIALLAASRGAIRNRSTFAAMAPDMVLNYTKAAGFTSSFVVPPMAFSWLSTSSIHCTSSCTPAPDYQTDQCPGVVAWDLSDAVRAINLCKAKYYASLANVSLGATLDSYCNAWLGSGGFNDTTFGYSRQYSLTGTPCNVSLEYENLGLGAAMHFAFDRSKFGDRLGRAFRGKYDHTAKRFDPQYSDCMGTYFPAFAINNFGSGIGRDRAAFQAQPLSTVTLVADAALSGTWSATIHWSDVGATYTLQRSTNNFASITTLATGTSATSYTDTPLDPNAVYLYRVIATAGAESATSNVDAAFTFTFTDASPVTIKAAHFDELRTAINALRTALGLSAVGSAVTQGQLVEAADLTPLRSGLNQALDSLGTYATTFCQPSIDPQTTPVRQCDVTELRASLR